MPKQEKKKSAPVVSPSLDPNAKWFTVAEAARYIRVSPGKLRHIIHAGQLKAVRGLGVGFRIDRADLDSLLARSKRIIPPYRQGSRPWIADYWKDERKRRERAAR